MKKQILNLGKGLSKAEQRNVFGGNAPGHCDDECQTDADCTNSDYPKCKVVTRIKTCPEKPEVKECVM